MSTNYGLTEENSPVGASYKMDKWLRRLILTVSIILGAELIWIFGITPLLPLSVVEVSGIPGLDRAAILEKAGIRAHSSYITVNPQEAERALKELYQVESAQVIKSYPDTLRIILEPRKPAAIALATVEGKPLPLLFDKNGVVIRIGKEIRELPTTPLLPIISGLIFEQVAVGMRLPALFTSFLSNLDAINMAEPELLTAISEIRINPKSYNGFDLILYPVSSPIRVRVESELNVDVLRYMILMIDVLLQNGVAVDEIDLRTSAASYSIKEASFGY